MDIDDLLREGSLSPAMADFLRACVLGRMNILVSGGTGSGKTTLAERHGAPTSRDNQRVVTIEDAAELQIQHPHVVVARAPPAQRRGQGRADDPPAGPQLASGCGPTGSSSERSAAPRPSTCSRP